MSVKAALAANPAAALHPILRRLRQERLDAGLSLLAFARESGTTAAAVGSHERGDRAVTLPTLTAWAAVFGLEVVLRPIDADGDNAYRRGFEAAVDKMCASVGIRTDAQPLALDVDWDDALNDGYAEPQAAV